LLYSFEDFLLDTARRELRRSGTLISLQPQVFDLLEHLIRSRERVVGKDDLLAAVWNGRIVSEATVSTRINAARRAVGDSGEEQRLIRTAYGKGIRFVGTVREQEGAVTIVGGVAATEQPDKPSIAVLPFKNLSGDPDQEYFADGMVEEITTALSKVRWFFVIARNSAFAYKGHAVDVKQISREFRVRYVLEGSVRKAGDRVRISAQLIDATTGNHIWAERYDRELADIFAAQDEITERVVAAIEPQLYAAEHFRSRRKPPESLDAWECVVRALSSVGQDTRAGLAAAEALCRRAIALAPGYGQAHSLLAWILVRRSSRSGGDLRTVLPEASAEARTALDLDERDPWAQLTHGVVLWRMRRHGEAERAIRRALELNPNFALAHAYLGLPLGALGAHKEAAERAQHALRLSPSDLLVGIQASLAMAQAHFCSGHYADCIVWARLTLERSPEFQPAHFMLIAAAAMHGDMAAASGALATLLGLRPGFSLAWISENMAFAGDPLDRLLAALRKAGAPEGSPLSGSPRSASPQLRAIRG
jgi:TolB-like protein/Tfp pilus assembly protein PilF